MTGGQPPSRPRLAATEDQTPAHGRSRTDATLYVRTDLLDALAALSYHDADNTAERLLASVHAAT